MNWFDAFYGLFLLLSGAAIGFAYGSAIRKPGRRRATTKINGLP